MISFISSPPKFLLSCPFSLSPHLNTLPALFFPFPLCSLLSISLSLSASCALFHYLRRPLVSSPSAPYDLSNSSQILKRNSRILLLRHLPFEISVNVIFSVLLSSTFSICLFSFHFQFYNHWSDLPPSIFFHLLTTGVIFSHYTTIIENVQCILLKSLSFSPVVLDFLLP